MTGHHRRNQRQQHAIEESPPNQEIPPPTASCDDNNTDNPPVDPEAPRSKAAKEIGFTSFTFVRKKTYRVRRMRCSLMSVRQHVRQYINTFEEHEWKNDEPTAAQVPKDNNREDIEGWDDDAVHESDRLAAIQLQGDCNRENAQVCHDESGHGNGRSTPALLGENTLKDIKDYGDDSDHGTNRSATAPLHEDGREDTRDYNDESNHGIDKPTTTLIHEKTNGHDDESSYADDSSTDASLYEDDYEDTKDYDYDYKSVHIELLRYIFPDSVADKVLWTNLSSKEDTPEWKFYAERSPKVALLPGSLLPGSLIPGYWKKMDLPPHYPRWVVPFSTLLDDPGHKPSELCNEVQRLVKGLAYPLRPPTEIMHYIDKSFRNNEGNKEEILRSNQYHIFHDQWYDLPRVIKLAGFSNSLHSIRAMDTSVVAWKTRFLERLKKGKNADVRKKEVGNFRRKQAAKKKKTEKDTERKKLHIPDGRPGDEFFNMFVDHLEHLENVIREHAPVCSNDDNQMSKHEKIAIFPDGPTIRRKIPTLETKVYPDVMSTCRVKTTRPLKSSTFSQSIETLIEKVQSPLSKVPWDNWDILHFDEMRGYLCRMDRTPAFVIHKPQ
ncbi:hypothetical protein PVAG01_02533 [Phlyctema vagabunda]|uniref:Uncharacterized protein n=1 Tax=Phlyctema vagabunda TaxID=108571 RepID=A0ABR4PQV5_9HELO